MLACRADLSQNCYECHHDHCRVTVTSHQRPTMTTALMVDRRTQTATTAERGRPPALLHFTIFPSSPPSPVSAPRLRPRPAPARPPGHGRASPRMPRRPAPAGGDSGQAPARRLPPTCANRGVRDRGGGRPMRLPAPQSVPEVLTLGGPALPTQSYHFAEGVSPEHVFLAKVPIAPPFGTFKIKTRSVDRSKQKPA